MGSSLFVRIASSLCIGFSLFYSPLLFGEEKRSCAELLDRFIVRISPPIESSRKISPPAIGLTAPLSADDLKVFLPTFSAESLDGRAISFSLKTADAFKTVEKSFRGKGIWIFFNPSEANDRVKTGHLTVLVNHSLFSRNVDEGPIAMTSVDHFDLASSPFAAHFLDQQYVVAQFFEMNSEDVNKIEKFFNDRVWNYHAGVDGFRTKYVPLPYTRDNHVEQSENCVTFVYSFLDSKWIAKRPELRMAANHFGAFEIDEIPSRQVYLNADISAYRGTFLIGKETSRYEETLLNGPLTEQFDLFQLRLKNSVRKLSGDKAH